MLTREEANEFIDSLTMVNTGSQMVILIEKYTEKPKIEEAKFLMQGITMLKDKSYILTIREFQDAD